MAEFTREELQSIRKKAIANAKLEQGVFFNYWASAYRELAYAADRLDAMKARDIK